MIKFISSLALVASIAERVQADLLAADLTDYVTAQTAITNEWERAQDCNLTDSSTDVHAGTETQDSTYGTAGTLKMAFVHIPKSG